jgi:hypothetical protein
MSRWSVVLAVVVVATTAHADTSDWKKRDLKQDCRCSIQMPLEPKYDTMPTPTEAGTIQSHMASIDLGSDTFFAVMWADYPAAALANRTPDSVLDGARDGAVANVKGKLLAEKKLTANGYPGREIRIGSSDKKFVAIDRLYVVKTRLYQVMAVWPAAGEDVATTRRYIESFTFTKP